MSHSASAQNDDPSTTEDQAPGLQTILAALQDEDNDDEYNSMSDAQKVQHDEKIGKGMHCALLEILDSHLRLTDTLDKLDIPGIREVNAATRKSTLLFRKLLSKDTTYIPRGLTTPSKGRIPLREGAVEIHEHILSFLNARELRSVFSVSKRFQDVIADSSVLQRHLCVTPRPRDFFYSPFAPQLVRLAGVPGYKAPPLVFGSTLTVSVDWNQDGPEWQLNEPVEAVIHAEFDVNRSLPTLGEAARKTLVCNPPVQEMEIKLSCCRPRQGPQHSTTPEYLPMTVSNANGINIGQLLELTETFRASHRLCPNARITDLDARGYVWVRVRFIARAMLRWQDPIVQDEV